MLNEAMEESFLLDVNELHLQREFLVNVIDFLVFGVPTNTSTSATPGS
jgi:hypothetical protein